MARAWIRFGLLALALLSVTAVLLPLAAEPASPRPASPPGLEPGLHVPVHPVPDGPVYNNIPGALPPLFHYRYNRQVIHGWPLKPFFSQHPIRGSFLDPRGAEGNGLSDYHFGIDINVDDRHPEYGAPRGLSHRVYAVESGNVSLSNINAPSCFAHHLEVGHFAYWHVFSTVKENVYVKAGEQIGWTCLGAGHVHLSEWQRYQGHRIWVNPLHRGGLLFNHYSDSAPPIISKLAFFSPPRIPWQPLLSLAERDSALPLKAGSLKGLVELRVEIDDPQSYLGFLKDHPNWPADFSPYKVTVKVVGPHGQLVLKRVSFIADQMPQTPYLVHYAPGSVENENLKDCAKPRGERCSSIYWFRPFSRFHEEYWDTRRVRNGSYQVAVSAWDIAGNSSQSTVVVQVANRRRSPRRA